MAAVASSSPAAAADFFYLGHVVINCLGFALDFYDSTESREKIATLASHAKVVVGETLQKLGKAQLGQTEIPVRRRTFGQVQNMPVEKEGYAEGEHPWLLVTEIAARVINSKGLWPRLLVPDSGTGAVRNKDGKPIGTTGLLEFFGRE